MEEEFEVEIVNDGDGVAVFGDAHVVDELLTTHGLASRSAGLPSLSKGLSMASGAAMGAAEIAENSGRWVKLTEESARALRVGKAMKGSSPTVSRAIVTSGGKTSHIVEFVKPGLSVVSNPAVLAGAGGIMAQLAMQQAMDEITDYLKAIDAKVDDVIRAQKDSVIAGMIGVGLMLDETMHIRASTGRVSEVTWSKIQTAATTIATTQAYALRQLDAHAEKLEKQSGMGEVAKAAAAAEAHTQEWLAVLARAVQLQEAIGILELDRVLDSDPDDLDSHRIGLHKAREQRLQTIGTATENLVRRITAAAGVANTKVLMHPKSAGAIVGSSNRVTADVVQLHEVLGIETGANSVEARRWRSAAADARDKAVETGAAGALATKQFGVEAADRAKVAAGGLTNKAKKLRKAEASDPE